MSKLRHPVFDKVLTIGPRNRHSDGGISAVLASYTDNFDPFHFLSTSSRFGMLAGLIRLGTTMARMPFARLKGRKIAHFHYAGGKSWYRKRLLATWARFLGYKVVMHCHAAEMKAFTLKKGISNIKKVLDKASANIVLSHSWKSFFENEIKCRNVYIVNNIVPPPNFEHQNTPINESRTFLFMGALGGRKGIFETLEAVSSLKKEGLNFKLIVGGNGEIDRFKNEVSRLGLEDIVDFRGWISGDDKNTVLAECDVLLLPSHNEGLPISILEAMSYGKAVLSTPVGGIPEVIQDGLNGFLVTPGSVTEIEEAMRKYILSPSLAKEHGKASLPKISLFYPEVVGAQLIKIYSAILSDKS